MQEERKGTKGGLKLFDYSSFSSTKKYATKTVLIVWLVLFVSFFVRGFYLFPDLWLRWVTFLSFLVIVSTFLFVLISLGKLRLANWSLSIALWLFIAFSGYLIGVSIAPNLFIQISVVLTALFLLGWKGGITLLVLVLISSFTKPYLDSFTYFASPIVLNYPLVGWIEFTIILSTIFILWYYKSQDKNSSDSILQQKITGFAQELKVKEVAIAELQTKVKRAETLYAVSRILHKDEFSSPIVYQQVIDTIAQSYQHPHKIAAQLNIGKACYKTSNFRSSNHAVHAEVESVKGVAIRIEIDYLKPRQELDEESLLEEEELFLNELLAMLTVYAKHKECTTELNDYKKALDSASMVCVTEVGGDFSYVNENFARISKYNCSELIGKNYKMLSTDFHSTKKFQEVKDTIRKGEIFRGEFRNKAKDGSFYWIDSTIVPISNQEGKVCKYICINHNITELKEVLENFRISQERYKSIINVSNTGAWEYNFENNQVWYSKQYFSLLGIDRPDMTLPQGINTDWIDKLHPEDKEKAVQTFEDFIKGDSTGFYENIFRLKHENGKWVWIWSRAKKLKDSNGNVTSITLGTHIDISDRVKSEQKIRESEQLMRKITSQVPGNTYMFEIEESGNCIMIFNNKGTDLFNHPFETHELLKAPEKLINLIHDDDRVKFDNTMKDAFHTQAAISIQFRLVVNGHSRWRWLQAIPEKDVNGKIIWYGATSDITDLVDYITSIEQIIFDIGHVIRRPLCSMIGMTKLLMENYFNPNELKDSSTKLNLIALEMDKFIHELNRNYQQKRKSTKLNIDVSTAIDNRNSLFK
ncbi:PAS domain-containing protein [Flavobacterium sp. TAB 87]|uniref:PAS domain-containing protein n=1 Tax=Flavobacterium sp. TAB 87 TaxID=1729581 RepID=UPI00076D8FD1|nr:PAS domain-containing protein [Flavobacterium sp. TAB 87]KVV15717.1 Nitrogen fixation regulatory protein [Flavobacterium sp. TAB 87]